MHIMHIDGKTISQHPAEELPALYKTADGALWVNMVGPSKADLEAMRDVFHFHPMAIEDTHNHRQRPKIEAYPDHLFLIINAVEMQNGDVEFHEVDIFVGAGYVVTVFERELPAIREIEHHLETMHERGIRLTPSHLLYVVTDVVIDGYFPVLDHLGEEIDRIEQEVLDDPRDESQARLFAARRSLVELWRVVWPHRDVFSQLRHHDLPGIDHDTVEYYLRDVADHLHWIADMVNTLRDTVASITDLYMTSNANRLSSSVNRLTVLTISIGVLTVISGFYGMNFEQTWPPFNAPWGVPFVIAAMGSSAVALWLVAKMSKWY